MTRAYRGEHRSRQAAQTRQRIVDALVEQVVQSGRSDFSIAEVAERAGVAERTIYRYFPAREDLLRAIDEHFAAQPHPQPPKTLRDFPAAIAEVFDWFAEHSDLVSAAHVAGLGAELHQRGRARRGDHTRKLLEEWLAPLPAQERQQVYAAVRTMFGSATWRAMRELGASNDEARETARWIATLLTKDVEARLKRARSKPR